MGEFNAPASDCIRLCRLHSLSVRFTIPDDTKTVTYTWHSDVKPLVDNYCIRCHTEGNIGVGDFNDQDTVFALADLMLASHPRGLYATPSPTRPVRITSRPSTSLYPARDKAIFATWVAEGKR